MLSGSNRIGIWVPRVEKWKVSELQVDGFFFVFFVVFNDALKSISIDGNTSEMGDVDGKRRALIGKGGGSR